MQFQSFIQRQKEENNKLQKQKLDYEISQELSSQKDIHVKPFKSDIKLINTTREKKALMKIKTEELINKQIHICNRFKNHIHKSEKRKGIKNLRKRSVINNSVNFDRS